MDGSRHCSREIIDQWTNAMVVRRPANTARIGANPGRFTAVEKRQLIVDARLIGSSIIARIATKRRGRDNFNELVQSKGARTGAALDDYIFLPSSRHNFAAAGCLN
jgi:hypothetical protein